MAVFYEARKEYFFRSGLCVLYCTMASFWALSVDMNYLTVKQESHVDSISQQLDVTRQVSVEPYP